MATILIVLGLVGVVGLFNSQGTSPAQMCTDAITAELGAKFSNHKVTENIETPGGAIDIRGEYDGGTFACALGRDNTLTLYQAIIYTPDGLAENMPIP